MLLQNGIKNFISVENITMCLVAKKVWAIRANLFVENVKSVSEINANSDDVVFVLKSIFDEMILLVVT